MSGVLVWISFALFALVIALCGTSIFIERFAQHLRREGLRERPVPSDVGIVLGAYTDGYRPSKPLLSRLRAALHLYRHGYIRAFIVSGGRGDDETVSESSSMKRFLIMNGVPPQLIHEERWSSNTWENLKNSQALMERLRYRSAVIVTSDYHLPRALAVARTLGIEASGCGAPSSRQEFRAATREVFAHIQYTLRGREAPFWNS
ncbi:hypothetical protein URH17368_0248 [Alicyclobacillus hesperidum URH17-3-68]|nr:hypothetical protein URH17368_0248 [Alicyclobacillus hesperidum URH17-3-68]